MQQINNFALLTVLLFVFVPIVISYHQKLQLGKEILFSSIRGFVQLLLLGWLISYLFSMEKWYYILFYILLMNVIASLNISKRGTDFFKTFWLVLVSIFLSVFFCLGFWLAFDVIPFTAQYIIPVGGMFTGSAMVASSVILEAMKKEGEIEEIRKEAVKLSHVPTLDTLKTIGLVQIPGTMTGMILAGADPFESVKYQIFIIFTLLVVTSFSSILTSLLNRFALKK